MKELNPPLGMYWEVVKVLKGDLLPGKSWGFDEEWAKVTHYRVLLCLDEIVEGHTSVSDNPKARWWNSEPKEITKHVPDKAQKVVVDSERINPNDGVLDSFFIAQAMNLVLGRLRRREEVFDGEQRYLGKYPPKTLEDK